MPATPTVLIVEAAWADVPPPREDLPSGAAGALCRENEDCPAAGITTDWMPFAILAAFLVFFLTLRQNAKGRRSRRVARRDRDGENAAFFASGGTTGFAGRRDHRESGSGEGRRSGDDLEEGDDGGDGD